METHYSFYLRLGLKCGHEHSLKITLRTHVFISLWEITRIRKTASYGKYVWLYKKLPNCVPKDCQNQLYRFVRTRRKGIFEICYSKIKNFKMRQLSVMPNTRLFWGTALPCAAALAHARTVSPRDCTMSHYSQQCVRALLVHTLANIW